MATYSDRLSYTNMAKDMAVIGGGFIVSGFTGRFVENSVKSNVSPSSPTSDKIMAGVANNAPKIGLYYIFTKMGLSGAASAAIGSVGYDALIRLTNKGVNPANVNITFQGEQYRILQEQQKQLQPQQQAMPFSNQQSSILDRQRKYGAMPNFDRPLEWQQPRYGSLPFDQSDEKQARQHRYGFAAELPTSSKSHVAKMFNML